MNNKENAWIRFSDRIVSAFRKSADQLEKFSLEAKLGSMDFRDFLKKVVYDFRKNVTDLLNRYNNFTSSQRTDLNKILDRLNHLRYQLITGKNEGKVKLEEQFKTLVLLLRKFESVTGKIVFPDSYRNYLRFEISRLKNKFKILKLRLDAKRLKANYLFKKGKRQFYHKLNWV